MNKQLHTAKNFIAFFLALALAIPMVSLWDKSVDAAYYDPETSAQIITEDCISRGYGVDAFNTETLIPQTFITFEELPASTVIGNTVRTWGSQFAISSAAEWSVARNPISNAAHVAQSDIIINDTIGILADPTAHPDYQRDERGALMLAPGVLTATYETVPFAVNNFTHLINSFGADTPDGTWIEVWVRAGRSADDLANIGWLPIGSPTAAMVTAPLLANPHSAANLSDGFLTSGRWSPFSQDFEQGVRRTTSTLFVSGGAQQSVGSLVVSGAPANVVQYRVTLHRDSETIPSPVVRHVHGTTRNAQIDQTSQPKEFPSYEFPARNFGGQVFPGGNTDTFPTLESIFEYLEERPIDMERQGWNRGAGDTSVVLSPGPGYGIYMQGFPMRSQQATGPILGGVNCSAVTIGMIVNGFLNMEDITPLRPMEEIGLNLFDYQLNGFGNWQFTVAGAGTYGLRAHVEYNDRHNDDDVMMETILRHLLSGHALGLSLQFSSDPTAPHFLPRTDGTTGGHLIVLLGVVQRSGNWYVISYEPWSGSGSNANDRVYREFPMQNLVNAMRFSGLNGTHNILYVVKPGVEPGAGGSAPVRLESYLVQIAPGEFALSTDGTDSGIISIGGMDRGQIGGPSGFIAYTIDPAFNFMGTTINDPHGQGGTKFRYLHIGDTIRFGYDAHISPVQPFTYVQLTDPNFRMYIMMGNGFTHVIDSSRVPSPSELYPELRSPGGEFRVNNPLRTVAPYSVPLLVGDTTIGVLREGLEATMGGTFAIFPEGTVIESITDFLAATPKPDSATLAHGDFIIVVNGSQTLFAEFSIDYFGLRFEHSGIDEIVRVDLYTFTRAGSPNFYSWSNPLLGWDGPGRIVYTADLVASAGGAPISTFPTDLTDNQEHNVGLRNRGTAGFANIPMRFVEANPNYPGGFRLIPYSTTGEIMPWRMGLVRITATIEAADSNDPFDGEYRSFYVRVLGGGPGYAGADMRVGEYETGHLTPSFTWGSFRAPIAGERAYNLTFHDTAILDTPVINVAGRPASPVSFPYVPYENDRPYWTWYTTWDGSAYANATTHTRVNWFWLTPSGDRLPVPLDENHGYTFQPGTVYIADLFLCTGMHAAAGTWMNLPPAGAPFNTFVSNIAGLPAAGEDGISNIVMSRSTNWNLLATMTFDQLPGERPEPGYLLSVSAGAGGTVPEDASGRFEVGTPINVLATANPGYQFESWTITGATIIGGNTVNPAVFDMPSNAVTLVANFERIPPTIFGLHAFNNGNDNNASLAQAGLIRIWTQLDGVNALVPNADLEVTAELPDGTCAIEFIRVNQLWNNPGYVNLIDANKHAPWHTIYLTATLNGQSDTLTLINNRFLELRAFNNGTDAEVPSMAGNIRIWSMLGGVSAPIPMNAVIEAVDQDGNDALGFVSRNRLWTDTGWRDYYVNFDVTKDAPWQTIYFTVSVYGQTVTLRLINDWFTTVPVFGLRAYNNGTDAQVPGLAGTIRIWTQLDERAARVPYADLTVSATLLDGTCALEFVHINRIWDDTANVNRFDVNKNAQWQYINLSATLFGQTVDLLLINNRYVPAILELVE